MILKSKNTLATISLSVGKFIGLTSLLMAGCSEAEKAHHPEDAHSVHSDESDFHQTDASANTGAVTGADTNPVHNNAPNIRSADSHIHGGAMLSIVSENDKLSIEFETPLYNLLGFEYAPQTASEKTLVSDVETALAQPQKLISFNSQAKCTFSSPVKDIELFHHDSEPDDHDDEHHDDKDEHDEEHHDDDENSESHKDIILSYELTCKAIEKLKTVKVEFFNAFPNFAELDLVYLGQSQQMSVELSPSRTTADLTR